ncbi:MAG: adenylate/guanylate cyclase domain-containing protein [Rhizobiaceae bacterium]|nr:adenylate/guanylate cyclase domain-containing protein [Rhizobiaceae bacterium]
MKRMLDRLWEAVCAIWPRAQHSGLPVHVSSAITRNDDISEVLVKLIQFGVFALWGVAYLAAPQPNPETISRVPLVISVYLGFTLVMMLIALTRKTPVWLIYLSILVDMVLLTYLIWSFHIQYGQEASFSLKVVEVMNFFVLICLRALRFEARYVLAAGLTAITCWSALVFYVVSINPSDPMITKDYITYITSNSVLIGAEVSKMISMLMFTAILAIAVRRGHHFLISSVAESSAAQNLSRFMSTSVAEQIRDSDHTIQAGEGERRDVAILNVDIRGFTELVAQMDPDEAMGLLSDYQQQIVPIVHRHGGTIDKFMGDGIMITFGATSADPLHCANALRCIDEILATHRKWTGPAASLTINMAVTAGPVIFGVVGHGDRLEVTVIGAAVNFSANLEKHNKVLGTTALSGEHCFRAAIKQGYENTTNRRMIESEFAEGGGKINVVVLA